MPKASIIIPTFNRCSMLGRAVESAFRSGGDAEVIIIDDASIDETPRVCQSFPQAKVIRLQKNVGLAGARNAGIEQATGDYIVLLDDDDVRLPDSLPSQIQQLESHPDAAFCYGKVIIGDNQTCEPTADSMPGELPVGDLFWKLLRGNFIPAVSTVIRKTALQTIGSFDPSLRQVEDWDLWLRLSERSSVQAVPEPVAIYRAFLPNSEQLSSNRARMARAAAAVQKKAMRLPRARHDVSRARCIRAGFVGELRFGLLIDSVEALLGGHKRQAVDALHTLLRIFPVTLFRSAEFRALLKLAHSKSDCLARPQQKQLKSIRKHLWDTISEHIPVDDVSNAPTAEKGGMKN